MNETPLTTEEWPEPGERVRRLREAVKLIKQLWAEDYVTFEGKYFNTRAANLFDKPDKPIPVLIAAGGPQVATFAGREGDGIIVTSGKGAELYKDTLLLYDCHFIPHRWVLEDHVQRGAKRVEYWPFGYLPSVHAPVAPSESPGPEFVSDVSFVGRIRPV